MGYIYLIITPYFPLLMSPPVTISEASKSDRPSGCYTILSLLCNTRTMEKNLGRGVSSWFSHGHEGLPGEKDPLNTLTILISGHTSSVKLPHLELMGCVHNLEILKCQQCIIIVFKDDHWFHYHWLGHKIKSCEC